MTKVYSTLWALLSTDMTTNRGHDGAEPPPWDEEAALEATGGDPDLARELLATLAGGLAADLEGVTGSYRAADWVALAKAAHHLRGATSYCGVPALDRALRDLERAALAGNPDGISQGVAAVELEAERLRDWMALNSGEAARTPP